jgi:cold shock CspA family protein
MTLIPTQISFRGLAHSDALETDIRERVAWLEQFHDGILDCRVVVELPHRHRRNGRHFHVRIEVTVPRSAPIVVSHQPLMHKPINDAEETALRKETEAEADYRYARVAVHEAFNAARRQLQDLTREQRGNTKTHEVPAHGRVAEISAIDGFGFIEADERRFYFAQASVLNDAFDGMQVGAAVAFVSELGEKGPQASTVRLLGRHHYLTREG